MLETRKGRKLTYIPANFRSVARRVDRACNAHHEQSIYCIPRNYWENTMRP